MKQFSNAAESSKSGVKSTFFSKSTIDAVQTSVSDAIYDRLAKGVTFAAFFGHSAVNVLDYDINNPALLKNKGRYPCFLAMGCSAGNMFQATKGVSEDLTFYKDKGMILFSGTSGTSYLNALQQVGNRFFDIAYNRNLGKGYGELIQETIAFFDNTLDNGLKSAIQELVINGDPSVKLVYSDGPDYVVDNSSLSIEPAAVTLQEDSIRLNFNLKNLGLVSKDSFNINFSQQLADGQILETKKMRVASPQYLDSLSVFLPLKKSVGLNKIIATIDPDNRIDEKPNPQAEANNALTTATGEQGYPFYIFDNNARPVYPANFGIVNSDKITLKASTSDALAPLTNYILEIDTTENFNSPFKKRTTISQKRGYPQMATARSLARLNGLLLAREC
ncbi:MAG: hypothetical protein HC817_03645 [Saprospiraceae bacterium]|nr:hypothetical protein [Saprospiraceae bacterium]